MAALLGLGLSFGTTASSDAAITTCDGQPATIIVSAEPDAVEFGTDGDDVVVITTTDVFTFDAKGGNDTVCAGPHSDVYGGDGDDVIEMGLEQGTLVAHGGAGDDTITGGPFAELLQGDTGNDTIAGGDGDDQSSGGSGDDRILGGPGDDLLGGGVVHGACCLPSDDQPAATPGTDTVSGGPGDDVIADSGSDETLAGNTGRDVLSLLARRTASCFFHDRLEAQTPVIDVGAGTVQGLGTDVFTGFESYRGGRYQQTLIGSRGPDDLVSRCGHTTILGRGGDDTIVAVSCRASVHGGAGADQIHFQDTGTVSGGDGPDTVTMPMWEDRTCHGPAPVVHGDAGRDWLVLRGSEARFWSVIDLSKGLLRIAGSSLGEVSLDKIENVRSRGPAYQGHVQVMTGTPGPNILLGRDGPSVLRGLGGDDVLIGGKGSDRAVGGPGHDRCRTEVRYGCEGS